jgi:hypothetical protein
LPVEVADRLIIAAATMTAVSVVTFIMTGGIVATCGAHHAPIVSQVVTAPVILAASTSTIVVGIMASTIVQASAPDVHLAATEGPANTAAHARPRSAMPSGLRHIWNNY